MQAKKTFGKLHLCPGFWNEIFHQLHPRIFLILTSSFKVCKLQIPSARYISKPADDPDNVQNRKTATFPIYAKHFEEHSGICQLVQKKVGSRVRWCVHCLSRPSKEQVSTAVTVWTLHLLPRGGTWDGNPSNLFSHILHPVIPWERESRVDHNLLSHDTPTSSLGTEDIYSFPLPDAVPIMSYQSPPACLQLSSFSLLLPSEFRSLSDYYRNS